MVYEGDINKYWLNSIGHESVPVIFSNLMLTAYIITSMAKMLGYGKFLTLALVMVELHFVEKF